MPHIMLYCQYLSGMGHLVRSTQFARALAQHFEVTVVIGGPRIDGYETPQEVNFVYLPPLWQENGTFRVADGDTVDLVKTRRKQTLISLFDQHRPDVVITEFFPFGRHDLLFELEPWMRHIRTTSPETLILSSLRDLVGKVGLHDQVNTIARLANSYFDAALIHSDPQFLKFEECFPSAHRLLPPILHTGFIAQPLEEVSVEDENPFILVSVGGGRIGGEVLTAALGAAQQLADKIPHQFRLFTGPFLPEADYAALEATASNLPNVCLQRFTPKLMAYMQAADLSVSLAGYNTTMNVLRARVPAILIPFGHYDFDREQDMRASKLAELGMVDMLRFSDLSSDGLAERILTGLQRGRSRATLNLDGAETAATMVQALLADRATGQAKGA